MGLFANIGGTETRRKCRRRKRKEKRRTGRFHKICVLRILKYSYCGRIVWERIRNHRHV